nr:rhodanese-related sulfurtransferase [uncultured Albidiferax sp.]
MSDFLTAAFYQFVALPDHKDLQAPLQACCEAHGVKGMVLLATEGINGTIAGPPAGVRAVLAWLRSDPRLAALQHKEATASRDPFYRMKVRLKREIVTLGVPGVDPTQLAGQYVKPADWNALISDPDVVVVDTRNDYEVAIGSFEGALNPHTRSFAELPEWVDQARAEGQPLADTPRKPKVAMFCTGGIRCEKSTAYLRAQGFDEVYHLEGGILKYLETVPEADSLWRGQCFVFDERVSVGHGLVPGGLELCRSCRHPLTKADMASPQFERGVACARCVDQTTEAQKQGYRERERQMALAGERQTVHVGAKLAK